MRILLLFRTESIFILLTFLLTFLSLFMKKRDIFVSKSENKSIFLVHF